MPHQRRPSLQQTQPKTFRLTVQALLSLPHRLCNPPPPTVAKARSCGVIPLYKVTLEDVLNRKHLPPLGLKDFEEWLLFVEKSPENLYFILWLKEYTLQYNQWVQSAKLPRGSRSYRVTWPSHTSSQLAMFYARAKQTFFTPNGEYELDVPSDILAPFHSANPGTPHPDPAVFAEVAFEAERMLRVSLDRFVLASYTNVGTKRGLCGIAGGIGIALLGSTPPLLYTILSDRARWWRLTALPMMWLGLTILIASLNGVCMMIYVFGDLRQLRKFELTRPPISRPQPLTITRPRREISSPISAPTPITRPPILPIAYPHLAPPPQTHQPTLTRTLSSFSASSSTSTSTRTSSAHCAIHISPAYYDDHPAPDGPATANEAYTFPVKSSLSPSFTGTASFIHPYDPLCDDDYDFSGHPPSPAARQAVTPFDFDSLPLPPRLSTSPLQGEVFIHPNAPTLAARLTPKALLGYMQYKCNLNRWRVDELPCDPEKAREPEGEREKEMSASASVSTTSTSEVVASRFKLMQAVPAFASPLTRVLSPVVTRAQWEIVVRSAVLALVISWVVLGSLLAVPVSR